MRKMKAATKNKKADIQGAIAKALWDGYEYFLPDTPRRMTEFVFRRLKERNITIKATTLNGGRNAIL